MNVKVVIDFSHLPPERKRSVKNLHTKDFYFPLFFQCYVCPVVFKHDHGNFVTISASVTIYYNPFIRFVMKLCAYISVFMQPTQEAVFIIHSFSPILLLYQGHYLIYLFSSSYVLVLVMLTILLVPKTFLYKALLG